MVKTDVCILSGAKLTAYLYDFERTTIASSGTVSAGVMPARIMGKTGNEDRRIQGGKPV